MAWADMTAGIQRDGISPTSIPRNLGAATPTIVIGYRLTRTLWPTTSFALPNWFFQKSYESTTAGLAPGAWSSSIVNSLPSAGLTPSTEKYAPDTSSAAVGVGSPPVERLIVAAERQNTPSKNCFCCWRSRQIG